LPLVYGPGNKGNIYRMMAAIDRGFFPPPPKIPNGRSLVHVSNVITAALLAATSGKTSETYIVTDAHPYSTRQLYEMICRALKGRIPSWQMPEAIFTAAGRLGDLIGAVTKRQFLIDSESVSKLLGSAWYSSAKISRELGYHPTLDFDAALPELVAWYRQG
jgi:nucleoside-diphosphate-sugar epimerase